MATFLEIHDLEPKLLMSNDCQGFKGMSWTTGFRETYQLFEATVGVREAVSVVRSRGREMSKAHYPRQAARRKHFELF